MTPTTHRHSTSLPSSGMYPRPYILPSSQHLVLREVVEKFPPLRQTICEKLTQTLGEIKSGKVYRGVLWILGEYAEDVGTIQGIFRELRKVLGEIPIVASEQRLLEEAGGEDGETQKEEPQPKVEGGGKPKVLADGTYATETAFTSMSSARLEAVKAASKPPLRSMPSSHSACTNATDCCTHSPHPRWRFLHWVCARVCSGQARPAIHGDWQRPTQGKWCQGRGRSLMSTGGLGLSAYILCRQC